MILAALFRSIALIGLSAGSPGPLVRHYLIVGGGPEKKYNQVAIESNVRYALRIMPQRASGHVLFTDGKSDSQTVLYEDEQGKPRYRSPQLPRLDGPSTEESVASELHGLSTALADAPENPALLYFTGHGSGSWRTNFANNRYDLWNDQSLSVTGLAKSLSEFPKQTPLILVMVQCYSGAFGNVLFEAGDPAGLPVDRRLCGFFAASPDRMAAGCTPEVNEANYHDFTGYFFGALTGTDRLGKPVTGADYNHDGKVGMNEAFAYALLHDESIDTPVCTSDVFLRRFGKVPDQQILSAKYSDVRSWANPAQLAALDGLSAAIGLSGEGRIVRAYNRFLKIDLDSMEVKDAKVVRFVRLAKTIVLNHLLRSKWDERTAAQYDRLLQEEAGNPMRD